ncbi:hypothetical protein HanIR_Chr03g0125931 [Helianthus annuus]|nr:hypothetical protein HanIR_Chr03g0125931 [Helianthus annuus]
MDSDRPPPPPHRPTTTSDLFICFTSRHHSSSMKLPSKSSILSPGRTGLTTSLSRRLRTNRSIKGAASPAMFPATGKKKGSGFENPEPSSPKVTCIGQVRIKSKKKHRLRSLSRRHSTGDVSFRKLERKSLNISRSFGSSNERNNSNNNSQRWSVLEREELPECLLLMMYEPKLSMEVSKETWVSSKDFIRRQPSRKKPPAPPPAPVKPNAGQSTVSTTAAAAATTTTATLPSASKCDKHVLASASASAATAASVQPGRSSCSLPAPSSMAEMLEQKLVNAVGYEPFVLTRCKSEPMKTAAAKLAPDNCFWKNRKLEPLRRASFGVGAAGIGC